MCVYHIFHLDWPANRPPQVRFDLPEMQVLKGENQTCGAPFSQANPSGQLLAVHINRVSCFVCSLCVCFSFMCLMFYHVFNLLNSYNFCFVSWFGVCSVFPIC